MNYQEPYRIHQINFDSIVYSKIKTTETKRIIFIKYNDNKKQNPFVIQCPSLLNINEPYRVSNDYHELEIPLITQEKDKSNNLFNFFEDLDKKIITDAKVYSKMWFENIKNDSIKFKKIVKESDNFKEGMIKLKIIKNTDFETMIQIENKKRISVKDIPVDYWCKMLIEIYAIVINYQAGTFSIFIRPIILSFKEKQIHNYNYKFLEDSDSDKEDVPDSELSGIFIRQKNRNKLDNSNLTSSNVKAADSQILNQLIDLVDKSSSSEKEDILNLLSEKIKNSSSSSEEKGKKNKTLLDEKIISYTKKELSPLSEEEVELDSTTPIFIPGSDKKLSKEKQLSRNKQLSSTSSSGGSSSSEGKRLEKNLSKLSSSEENELEKKLSLEEEDDDNKEENYDNKEEVDDKEENKKDDEEDENDEEDEEEDNNKELEKLLSKEKLSESSEKIKLTDSTSDDE